MTKFNLTLSLCVIALLTSCGSRQNHTLKLDPRYNTINTIHAFAECRGPKGVYTTETRAENNYFFFFQRFTYRNELYTAIIDGTKAFELDSTGAVTDTLSAAIADAIGSHNFHWIAMRPGNYYDSIQFSGEEKINGVLVEKYTGLNSVHQPVTIHYDPAQQLITQILFGNPMDNNEKITVTFTAWKDTDFGKQPARLEIVQGTAGTYTFDFVTIDINDPMFSKTNPKAI